MKKFLLFVLACLSLSIASVASADMRYGGGCGGCGVRSCDFRPCGYYRQPCVRTCYRTCYRTRCCAPRPRCCTPRCCAPRPCCNTFRFYRPCCR
jgi:hypothetical protein